MGGKGSSIELVAEFSFDEVDFFETISKNMCPSLGRDEAEVYVNSGAKLKLKEIRNSEGENILDEELDLVA